MGPINFSKITELDIKRIHRDDIVFTEKTRLWCKLPYPDHKKGCPNCGKNHLCPPFAPYLENDEKFNSYRLYYLIFADFNFKEYKRLRQIDHPDWSVKKLKCVLYWQSSIKKLLKELSNDFIEDSDMFFGCGSGFNNSPSLEAIGIYVFKLYENIGIEYELKPNNHVILSCLLCSNNSLVEKIINKRLKNEKKN